MPSIQYTVVAGDSLSKIAREFGTSWPKIAADNNLTNPDVIEAGQVLTINLPDVGAAARKDAYVQQFEMLVNRVETAPTAAVSMHLE